AREDFEAQFSRRETPEYLETFGRSEVEAAAGTGVPGIVCMLVGSGIAASRSAARRLIQQGAVSLDGQKGSEIDLGVELACEHVIRGGRRMLRYVPAPAKPTRG